MAGLSKNAGAALAAIASYLVIWGGATAYLAVTGGDWITGLYVFGLLGVGLTGLAWLLTIGVKVPEIPVERPARESVAVLIYLALYAVLFLGFGLSAAREGVPEGQQQELVVMALKLTAHVVLPVLLLVFLGAKIGPLFQLGLKGRAFWRTLIVLGAIILALLCVISPSLRNISATGVTTDALIWIAPLSFIWITLEAGLCEEVLYRAVVQTRLSAWLKSPWVGIVVTSILFGLAHAPGLFMRGGAGVDGWSTDPLQVIAHTLAVLTPVGLLFGLIYARTKSLLLVVLLHGLVDVLPNMDDFIRIWT